MEEAARQYKESHRFKKVGVSATSYSYKGGKTPKQVDDCYAADGLTPEEVNDIRYSGIRLDMSTEVDQKFGKPEKLSDQHFHVST